MPYGATLVYRWDSGLKSWPSETQASHNWVTPAPCLAPAYRAIRKQQITPLLRDEVLTSLEDSFPLPQSFRFGSEIAYVGATLLDICKKVRKKTLVGNTQESDVRGVGVEGKEACLSRNNQTVFEDAVNRTGGDSPAKIHLLGVSVRRPRNGSPAASGKNLSCLIFLVKLEIKDPFIKRWVEKGLASIKDYAAKAEDKQLEMKIAIVEKYRERIPELLDRISRCHVPRPENADCILGTVHKAKGLEFDTVRIAGDFVNIPLTLPNPGIRSWDPP
ncbi:PREDICTED: F-box only protein 18-like, partial [Thamnophis sirtalis]|uniref:F-box only protein 18-like n=1 Tax=Thamnophis sirtalis TaxID=35019 RepID=A0A6I9YKL2_9SAUR